MNLETSQKHFKGDDRKLLNLQYIHSIQAFPFKYPDFLDIGCSAFSLAPVVNKQ